MLRSGAHLFDFFRGLFYAQTMHEDVSVGLRLCTAAAAVVQVDSCHVPPDPQKWITVRGHSGGPFGRPEYVHETTILSQVLKNVHSVHLRYPLAWPKSANERGFC